ncbi:MAG: hypothetical protein WCD76_21035 [Pyrinomonadaceae bacterium]
MRQLEESLDSDLKLRLTEYRKQRAALDAEIEQAERELRGLESQKETVRAQRTEIKEAIALCASENEQLDERLRRIADDKKLDEDVAGALSDHDLLRADM